MLVKNNSLASFFAGSARGILSPFRLQWQYRSLLSTLIHHEIKSEYSAGIYGYAWALLTPLITISIYSFVFYYVLNTSFANSLARTGPLSYALGLFIGLIQWDLFAGVLNQAPDTVSSKPNFVKKIVFPMEILPLIPLYVGLFHFLIAFIVLILVTTLLLGPAISIRLVVIPIIMMPLVLYSAGFAWLFSALGVFYRDLQKAIAPLTQLLWFISAIFFPISAVPVQWRIIFSINPVAALVDQARSFSLQAGALDYRLIAIHALVSLLFCAFGFHFFRALKDGFADVL